ncbi:DUF6463 family protein [Streptomyces purpureus]|uniref:DUF6463 family protein n=1 Tax=Streptomyces purpureus TaxID=1951 RepID=UPI00036B6A1E|nr:DUF6463 family protein [Streptomyces purpureus]
MNSRKRLLRWASAIMLVLGVGHLSLLALAASADIAGWVDRGVWAAVPLDLSEGAPETVDSLTNVVTFWAGPGSFSVPLVLLGCLIWHFAGRGVSVPAWTGWGLAVWCVLGGVLLVPSPFFVGAVSGVLIVLAARKGDRPAAVEDRESHVS